MWIIKHCLTVSFNSKKEHKVGDTLYYVSTRYNREQGIVQLRKMLILCEGSDDSFKILSTPDKTTHSISGKKSLAEIM